MKKVAGNHIFNKINRGSKTRALAEQLVLRPEGSMVRSVSTARSAGEAGYGVEISCLNCPATERIEPRSMGRVFGAKALLKECVRPCRACGSAKVSVTPIRGEPLLSRARAAKDVPLT